MYYYVIVLKVNVSNQYWNKIVGVYPGWLARKVKPLQPWQITAYYTIEAYEVTIAS